MALTDRIDRHCSYCGDLLNDLPEREQGGGQSRLFCSNAHRQAAYRQRKQMESRKFQAIQTEKRYQTGGLEKLVPDFAREAGVSAPPPPIMGRTAPGSRPPMRIPKK